MGSLGVCNFQNKYCGCQTYMEDEKNPEKCYYCSHYNAFHTGFSPPPQNSSPQLGICQKDGATCGCQAFVSNSIDELKCKYCGHFTAFHKQINNASSNLSSNGTSLHSSLTNAEITSPLSSSQVQDTSNIINTSGDLGFKDLVVTDNNKNRSLSVIKKRRRSQSRFRNKDSSNTIASRGRPANVSLALNHLLLFTQKSWENNSAPRENTVAWVEMKDNGLIIENVLFEENTPEAINAIISRSFPSVNEYNWILLNGATSKLKVATNQEKTLKNLRENMSKSNKRLYLALKETSNDSNEMEMEMEMDNEMDDNQNENDYEIKSESTD